MTWPGTWRVNDGAIGVAGEPVHAPNGERGVRGMVVEVDSEEGLEGELGFVVLAAVVSTALGVGLLRGEDEKEDEVPLLGAGRWRRSDILIEVSPGRAVR